MINSIKILDDGVRCVDWTNEEKQFLIENYPSADIKFLRAGLPNRSGGAIATKASRLGLKRDEDVWRYKHLINQDFFKTWSPEMACVLGFIIADGGITKRGGVYKLKISQRRDRHILEAINKAMDSDYKIYDYGHYELVIYNQEVCRDLMKLGVVERKSLIVECPDVPDEYLGDFVRGVFDGDGCVSHKYNDKRTLQIKIHSGSYKFLEKLQGMMNKVADIECSLFDYSVAPSGRISIPYLNMLGGYNGYLRFFKFIYHDDMGGLYLNRKRQKFMVYFKRLGVTG